MGNTAFQPKAPDEKALVTIREVEQRTVNKRDGTSFVMYDVFVVEMAEPFNTTKKEIAESAWELKGRSAEVTYVVKVNGNFTNYYINSILPGTTAAALGAQSAQPMPASTLQPTAVLAAVPAQTAIEPSPIPVAYADSPEKERAIHRQTAAKVAATLHAASPDTGPVFWENVAKLALYFDEGIFPGGPDSDDDIPF